MFVIGTAGHVDHGKSTLVQALSGIDPDRLKEEKERAMTIDLGFAWLQVSQEEREQWPNLPNEIGIVDVPGHRDFIENMLAGIGGIDLALFIIAADEGVMPQTREHLAILDLLEIRGGIIALTKADLIDDPDWLELVTLDVSEVFAGTSLAEAPIMPVSAQTGQGIAELRDVLLAELAKTEPRADGGRPRLPVDRVFTLSGFGTVVTGTLSGGKLQVGDAVEIQPADIKARIRGLQTHQTKRETAYPGSRVAINLTGVDKDEVQRGHLVAGAGVVRGTILCDVVYRHLADAGEPLKHNVEVKLFVGSAETVARTRVLGQKQIEPGQEGWLQLALRQPVAISRGDRFILRRPSPAATLGGGRILDPHPGRRHRRFRPEVVQRLETLTEGTPAELLLQTIRRLEPVDRAEAWQKSGLENNSAAEAWQELLDEEQIVLLGKQIMSRTSWEKLRQTAEERLAAFHGQNPLRLGMAREELRSRLKLNPALFNALLQELAEGGQLMEVGALVHLANHRIEFDPQQQSAVESLKAQFARSGINSPSVKEAKQAVGEDAYLALLDLGELMQINKDVVYTRSFYKELIEQITTYLKEHGQVNAAQVRDLLNTSRKYAIALLEHLDERQITRRVGDERQLIRGQKVGEPFNN